MGYNSTTGTWDSPAEEANFWMGQGNPNIPVGGSSTPAPAPAQKTPAQSAAETAWKPSQPSTTPIPSARESSMPPISGPSSSFPTGGGGGGVGGGGVFDNFGQQPTSSVTPPAQTNSVEDTVNRILAKLTQSNPLYANDALMSKLNTIQGMKYQFDDNNPALLQAQKQAMGQVQKDMARKGRVFDTYAATKAQEAAQGLIPSYYQLGMNQFNTDRNDQYAQLAAMQGMNTTAFNQNQTNNQNYIQAYGLGQTGANTQFTQNVTEAGLTGQYKGQPTVTEQDRIRNQEIAQYGTPLTPEIKQQLAVFQQMPQQYRAIVDMPQISADYAAEINRRAAVNPQDPLIPYLLAARTAKILSNPRLMQQYGSTIGLSSPAIAMMAQKYQADQIALYIDQLKAQYALPQYQAELEKVKAEALRAGAEAAYKTLEAANLPLKLKMELAGELAKISLTEAQTGAQQANAAESYANVNLRGEQMNTEKTQQVKYLADANKATKESFDYKGYDALNKHIEDTYYKGTSTNTPIMSPNPDFNPKKDIGPDNQQQIEVGKTSTSQKQISVEEKEALRRYLIQMESTPNVDQDIIKALRVTHNIK